MLAGDAGLQEKKKKEGEISNKYAYKPYNVIYSKWPFVWKMFKLFH